MVWGSSLASRLRLFAVVRYPPKGATCRPPPFYRLPFAAPLPLGGVGWGLACSEALGAFAPPAVLPPFGGGGLLFGYHLMNAVEGGGGGISPTPILQCSIFKVRPHCKRFALRCKVHFMLRIDHANTYTRTQYTIEGSTTAPTPTHTHARKAHHRTPLQRLKQAIRRTKGGGVV